MKTQMQRVTVLLVSLIIFGFMLNTDSSTYNYTTSTDSPLKLETFERLHTVTGATTLSVGEHLLAVKPIEKNSEYSVTVDLANATDLNLYLEPIPISTGGSLDVTLSDSKESVAITVKHNKISKYETALSVSLESLLPKLESEDLTITTYFEGAANHSITTKAASTLSLGNVTSDDEDWVKTWHIVCVDGDCELFMDPVDTYFEFETDPGQSYPFQYLGVAFKSNASFQNGTLKLQGRDVDSITITGEDQTPLELVNQLAL